MFTADGDMRQALNNLQVGSLSCERTPMTLHLMLEGIAALVMTAPVRWGAPLPGLQALTCVQASSSNI